ncbi:MAG: M3 family metallopeptidase [Promethearchaeota archaeon]
MKGKELAETALEQSISPRPFYLLMLENLGNVIGLPYILQFTKEYEKISTPEVQLDGKPVNLLNWGKFRIQTTDWSALKVAFDSFVEQAPELIPCVEQQFTAQREICERYNENPLDIYLEKEQIQYSTLTRLITQLAEKARKPFLQAAEHYCQEIKGEPFSPQDDHVFFQYHVQQPLNNHLRGLDPLVHVKRTLKRLGFSVEGIKIDSEDRPRKHPHAVCVEVRIPEDIRVINNPSNPLGAFVSVFHEFGHSIHALCANSKDPFWKRHAVPLSVAETFSFLIDGILDNRLYLTKELGLPSEVINDCFDRSRASGLFFTVFLAANSLMKLSFWKEGLSFEQASSRWENLTRRFYIEIPGNYWLLYPINVQQILYNPSYLMASVRKTQIQHILLEEFGEAWWEEPRAGKYIAELAETRAEFPISKFPLDPQPFLKQITQLSFT